MDHRAMRLQASTSIRAATQSVLPPGQVAGAVRSTMARRTTGFTTLTNRGTAAWPTTPGSSTKGTPPPERTTSRISKVGTQWNFYIDEALKYTRTQTDITSCWPGVAAIEWQNEMLNSGDQGGGPLSNYQNYDANQYQTSTGVWHPANRTVLSTCDANSYPAHWNCLTDNATANQFRSADDRLP